MAYSKRFADDVLEALNDKSQRAVAKKMGTSQTMISNMTSGRIPQDVELRDRHKISEVSLRKILQDIEEEEEKHLKGIKH